MECTRVNGIGLWNSWTRNFQTPLQALLDLLDNSFDASISKESQKTKSKKKNHKSNGAMKEDKFSKSFVFEGKIDVSTLQYKEAEKSGIIITNNSEVPIKPLVEILEVYRSTKGKQSESVGENGVGLKQGCATLSDLSFVISRKNEIIEIGVIASSLQEEEGIRLPSFKIDYTHTSSADASKSLMEAIDNSIEEDIGVIDCVKELGNGDYEVGINRLVDQCENLFSKQWSDYVFCVMLANLKHGSELDYHDDVKNTRQLSVSKRKNSSNKAKILLDELKKELPRFYIHVPPQFEFIIDSVPVAFNYWQNRLVELSSFNIKIDKKVTWSSYDKKDDEWKNPPNGYNMKLYLGFDTTRFKDPKTPSACCMFIYSRQSGRLIKAIYDARADLGLFNSGSDYSQGLTVIVDDCDGMLPLNPTKQDIAFGEEEYGNAHKANLFSWTAAYVFFFWNHHADKVDKSKRALGDKVGAFHKEACARIKKIQAIPMLPLTQLKLTTFGGINWVKHHTLKIRPAPKQSVRERKGRGTKFRIESIKYEDSDTDADLSDVSEKYVPTRKRKKAIKYNEDNAASIEEIYSNSEVGRNSFRSHLTRSLSPVPADEQSNFHAKASHIRLEAELQEVENRVSKIRRELDGKTRLKIEQKKHIEQKINDKVTAIVELQTKIQGMDRMMKEMINSVSSA